MARREFGPACLAMIQAVDAAIVTGDQNLLVACSGGADSVALAFAARRVAIRRVLGYSAVVVDHGLQAGSAAAAARARTLLFSVGYTDVDIVAAQVDPESSDGPEAAARTARYRVLEAAAAPTSATVLLGHTLDDQAETVLLGLARGSGLRSLAGMAVRNGTLLRPLLGLRRADTAAACAELGLEPWSDPQNADRRYARVRARQSVLPALEAELGPGVAEALARTAVLARDDADLLDALTEAAYPAPDLELDCTALLAQPAALRRRILRRWLIARGVRDLSLQHVQAVEALLLRWHGQGPIQLPGAVVVRSGGRLRVEALRA